MDDDIYEETRRRLLKHLADANEAHMRAIQPLLSALERLEGVRLRPEPILIPTKDLPGWLTENCNSEGMK